MTKPLVGSRLKLQRANRHLGLLKRHVRRFRKEHPHRIREQPDSQTNQYVKNIDVPETPELWGLLIGDFAHNLRSALDHIAWQMAIQKSPKGDPEQESWGVSRISWPIFIDSGKYERTNRPWLPGGFVKLVHGFQPCHRFRPPRADPLWLLHQLSNIDKHRLLHATVVDLRNLPPKPFRTERFDPETGELVEVIFGPAELPATHMHVVENMALGYAEVYVEGDFPFEVEVVQPGTELHEQPMLQLMDAMSVEVCKIIDRVEPLM